MQCEELTPRVTQRLEANASRDIEILAGKPAPLTTVKVMQKKLEALERLEPTEDVKVVYGVFVLGMREMAEPLIAFDQYDAAVEIAKHAKASASPTASKGRRRSLSWCSASSDLESDMAQLKPFVSVSSIVQLLYNIDLAARQDLGRVVALLQLDGDAEDFRLAEAFAPLLFRRKGSAYLSVRHRADLSDLMLVLAVMIDQHKQLAPVYQGHEIDAPSAVSTPQSSKSRATMHRAWSLSLLGTMPNLAVPPSSPMSSHETLQDGLVHHARKKTPPRAVLESMNRRRIELDQIISRAVDKLFILYDAEQSSVDDLQEERVTVDSASTSSGGGGGGGGGSPKATEWATRERVNAEKRALKKRLLTWDKDFERANGRKPSKAERGENRIVFLAYGAVKNLLTALDESPAAPLQELLAREKRALQAMLKLHEKDFETEHRRKVQSVGDIAGLELEYKRYKELKDMKGV